MPIFEIETDKGTFEIDADKEPTQAEALQAIAGLSKPQSNTPEFDQFRQQFIQQAQSPVAALPGQALDVASNLLSTVGGGIAAIPSAIDRRNAAAGIDGLEALIPYTPRALTARGQATGDLLQSALEGLVQGSFDIARMPVQRVESLQNIIPTIVQQNLPSPGSSVISNLSKAASLPQRLSLPGLIAAELRARLTPRTPSEQEVSDAFQASNLEQALQQEFNKGTLPQVLGEAQPGATEFVRAFGQPENIAAGAVARALGPSALRAASSIPSRVEALTETIGQVGAQPSPERILRTALKPSDAKQAQRLETSTKNALPEIFHQNPLADQAGSMPIEGFQQAVSSAQKRVGNEIDSSLRSLNITVNGGDDIARALNAEADTLARQGGSKDAIDFLRGRATEMAGTNTTIDDLRGAVSSANLERTPLFQQAWTQAAPKLAKAQNIANKAIAETGGKILNDALDNLKGDRGAQLRKSWSDLTNVENQANIRLNKILNNPPPEVRSLLGRTLSNLQGAAGAVGLIQGYPSGIIPLLSSAFESLGKREQQLLRDTNTQITRAYEALRANPPERPAISAPPVIPEAPVVPVINPEDALLREQTLRAEIARLVQEATRPLP